MVQDLCRIRKGEKEKGERGDGPPCGMNHDRKRQTNRVTPPPSLFNQLSPPPPLFLPFKTSSISSQSTLERANEPPWYALKLS